MLAQAGISQKANLSLVGKALPVLIEAKAAGYFTGRFFSDAYEVDGAVHIPGNNLKIGKFCLARVKSATSYDFEAEPEINR